MDNWQYLIGAYTIGWLGVAYYVFRNIMKLRALEVKVSDLEDKIKAG